MLEKPFLNYVIADFGLEFLRRSELWGYVDGPGAAETDVLAKGHATVVQ